MLVNSFQLSEVAFTIQGLTKKSYDELGLKFYGDLKHLYYYGKCIKYQSFILSHL